MLLFASILGAILFFLAGYSVRRTRREESFETNQAPLIFDESPRPQRAHSSTNEAKPSRKKSSPPPTPRALKQIFQDLVDNKSYTAAILSDEQGLIITGHGTRDMDGLAATVGMLGSKGNSALSPVWMTAPQNVDLGDDTRGWLSMRSFEWENRILYASVLGGQQALPSETETEMVAAARNYLSKIGGVRREKRTHG